MRGPRRKKTLRKNFELKRQITEVSELVTTTRVEINLMPSKRAETFQESNSVYIVFGSKRSLNVEGSQDNLAVPKEDTLAKQSNNDRYKQDIDRRHDFDGDEKFIDSYNPYLLLRETPTPTHPYPRIPIPRT